MGTSGCGMNPAFPMRLCTRCAHAPGHAAFDNTSSIVEKSRALLRGFVRNAYMPAAAHRSRSSDMACAVTAITGVRCPDTLSSSVGVAQEGGPRAHDVVRDDADPGDEECGGRGQRRQGPYLRADGQIAEMSKISSTSCRIQTGASSTPTTAAQTRLVSKSRPNIARPAAS